MTKRRFDAMALRSDIKKRKKAAYDDAGARSAGMKPVKGKDGKPHMGSRNPKTGTILKGRGHKTFGLAQAADELRGYDVKYSKGRYKSTKKKTTKKK